MRDPLAGILRHAEISFIVTLTLSIGFYITQIPFLRLHVQAPVPVDEHNEASGYTLQSCSSGVQFSGGSSPIVGRSSFAALAWSSTIISPVPLSQLGGVDYSGPSALLDDHAVSSCFSFEGSQGGAFLVSHATKYHISQFTLNNSAVDPAIGSVYYPKEGALWGLFEGTLPEELKNATTSFVTEYEIYVLVGNFCFHPERGPVQTFAIEENVATLATAKFSVFYVEVLSNWGGSHTCICRLQLHGHQ